MTMRSFTFVHSSPADRISSGDIEAFTIWMPDGTTPEQALEYVKAHQIGAPIEFQLAKIRKDQANQPQIMCIQRRMPKAQAENEGGSDDSVEGLAGLGKGLSDRDIDSFVGGDM